MSECESSPDDRIFEKLSRTIGEACDLRDLGALPDSAAGVQPLVECLRRARAASDRIEQILSDCIRIRATCQRGLKASQAAADDAWDNAANSTPAFNQAEASPRERYARYKLASMAHLRDARRWEQISIDVDAALEIIKNAHYGVRAYREDVNTLLRAMTLEVNLERG